MKAKIEINLPQENVFDLFTDKQKFSEWKIGFLNYEPLNGTQGEIGSTTKLTFKRFVMIETIKAKDKPNLYTTTYDYMQNDKILMSHIAEHKFAEISNNKTLLEVRSEIITINNLLMKIMLKLMAKSGERQFHHQLKLFKIMAEK
jgi:hypothetical protein